MSVEEMSPRERLAQQVVVGGEGYLYHRDHQAVEQVTGELSFTTSELNLWRNTLETRWAWCKANGIAFRVVIVPEKHVIISEHLPPEVVISANRPAVQLMECLPQDVAADCLYPVDVLSGAYERPAYYKTDTHFTMYGGFLVYKALMESLQGAVDVSPISEDALRFQPRTFTGDLGVRLEPEPEEAVDFISHQPPRPAERIFDNKFFSRGHVAVFESPVESAPRCVLIRDSFANYLIPHLIPVFSRVTAVGSTSMHYDLLRSERPDVVIFEIAERFLGYLDTEGLRWLPDDLGSLTFEQVSGVNLDELAKLGRG